MEIRWNRWPWQLECSIQRHTSWPEYPSRSKKVQSGFRHHWGWPGKVENNKSK